MKFNVLILVCTFLGSLFVQGSAFAADRVTTITCDFEEQHSKTVDKLTLEYVRPQAGPLQRTFEVQYVDGSIETGAIDNGVLEDRFGNTLKSEVGTPYQTISNTKAGEIVISFRCAFAPGLISPYRCISQGSGEHAAYAAAVIHLDDQKLDFRGFGNLPTCLRSVVD